jgi:hypothetical protein
MADWHPGAIKQPLGDAGAYTGGAAKLVWHTTEGSSYPGPSIYHGTNPHFTCDFKRRKLYQHAAISRAAKALEHRPGTGETNHDNAVQVELVDFAANSGRWTLGDYRYIAKLARWIEKNHGVKRKGLSPWSRQRLSWGIWHNFSGHCGHMHVPANSHVDPGSGFRIDLVLANPVSRVAKWTAELVRNRAAINKLNTRDAKLKRAIAREKKK